MPFIQNMSVPKQITGSYEIETFEYGLNNVKSAFELRKGESPDLLNVIALEEGSIETRPGLFKYITQNIGKNIKKMFLYETGAISMFLLSTATELFKINTNGTGLAKVCDVVNVISGAQHETAFYFVDGAKYRTYDGTDVYEIINPITITGVAQIGTGTTITLPSTCSAVDDSYNGYTVYISAGTGSGQSRTIIDYVGGTKIATVSNWSTSPDNTSVIYITNVATGSVVKNTTNKTQCYAPTYLDFTNTFKGLNNVPMVAKCTKLVLHKNRIWFVGDTNHPNIIYSTDIDNMFYAPTNNYYPPISHDNDNVTGIYSFNDVLIIFKNKTVYALFGDDYTNYDLKVVTAACGTINSETICRVGNYLYYLGFDGVVYSLYDVRTDYKKLLTKSISDSINLVKSPISIYPDDWSDSFAQYYNGYYFLKIHDKMLVYKVDSGWFLWDNINPTCLITYGNDLLLMNNDQYIYRLPLYRFYVTETFVATAGQTNFTLQKGWLNSTREDIEVTINGSPVTPTQTIVNTRTVLQINPCSLGDVIVISYVSLLKYIDGDTPYDSYWNTNDMDMGYHSQIKQIRNVNASIIAVDYNNVDLQFNAYVDYADVAGAIVVSNGISLWGLTKFGQKFSTRNTITPIVFAINRRGKIIRYKFSTSGVNQPFKLFNINGIVTVREAR